MKQPYRQAIELGLQGTMKPISVRSLGKRKKGIEALQTPKAFPRPKGHCIMDTLSFAGLLVALILVGAIVWNFESFDWTKRQVAYFVLNMVLSLIPIVWAFHMLYPRFDRLRVQKGKRKALGRVLATDHAGKIVENDAQQRALVEVVYENQRYLLVANQVGLTVDTNATVEVSWSSISQLCWIH
ncbi:hypothetical protein HX004_08300 [Myroides sp. 1354]|uniref:hypothetical protein n=1 Tax=unclassified Myroides TaxID=2642485 RepID=UPI0025764840|nr:MULTISPECIES: hypothetical protein [unclassified Myroides]MDM1045770.1 hypothetical protein [Myroides sp. R163-1]MDM1055775.1 hypothetical protein [Myroides sp. 1354]MDM1069867.1 hypothetical protein [Myroides sp. 1372]